MAVEPKADAYNPTGAMQVYYDIASRAVEGQIDSKRIVDGKLASIFTLATGALVLAAAVLPAVHLKDRNEVGAALVVAAVFYTFGIILLVVAYKTRFYSYGPDPEKLTKHMNKAYPEAGVRKYAVEKLIEAYSDNKSGAHRRACCVDFALLMLVGQVIATCVASGFALTAAT